jgi:hypothetical protein
LEQVRVAERRSFEVGEHEFVRALRAHRLPLAQLLDQRLRQADAAMRGLGLRSVRMGSKTGK